jgi:hypothetical protein
MVASRDGISSPSMQASSAVVVGAATSSAMTAYLARGTEGLAIGAGSSARTTAARSR